MSKLSLVSKIAYTMSVISIVISIILSIIVGKDFSWQIVCLFWIATSFVGDLRIAQLKNRQVEENS